MVTWGWKVFLSKEKKKKQHSSKIWTTWKRTSFSVKFKRARGSSCSNLLTILNLLTMSNPCRAGKQGHLFFLLWNLSPRDAYWTADTLCRQVAHNFGKVNTKPHHCARHRLTEPWHKCDIHLAPSKKVDWSIVGANTQLLSKMKNVILTHKILRFKHNDKFIHC